MAQIQMACVRYKNDEGSFVEAFGKSYEEIYEDLNLQGFGQNTAKWHEEGFLIEDDNGFHIFVDKNMATGIAKEQGIEIKGEVLEPSDIWNKES